MLTFQTFDSREKWLQARADTVGASTLSHYINDGTPPTPLPDNIPALQDALRFGSTWEPEIVRLYARMNRLKIAGKNVPFEEMEPNTITWHDNSYYLNDDYPLMHVSYDAIIRDEDGDYTTMEVKTGSGGVFWNVRLRPAYQLQAAMEATFINAKKALIVYAQRPPYWRTMTSDRISDHLANTMQLEWETPIPSSQLKEWLNSWNSQTFTAGDSEGNQILASLLEAKQLVEERQHQLSEWLEQHPQTIVKADGRVARLKESTTTRTDYAKYFTEHPANLADYQKTTTTTRLSIIKEK